MNLSALALIQSLIAPVVMISACGLICLALYNRLAAIVSRARAFNKERYDLGLKLAAATRSAAAEPAEAPEMRRRLTLLDAQAGQVLHRAKLVRAALYCLLATVHCMLGCSLALGLAASALLGPVPKWIALLCYVAGIALMAWGVVLSLLELRLALDPVNVEWRDQEDVDRAI